MFNLGPFALACVCAAVLAPAAALSKRVAPEKARSAAAAGPVSCADLPGVWTGFMGSSPLYDSYQLSWRCAK